ncbi:MAG: hypothetical protein CSB16_01270 [Clostridiales bacterium]|nr:MAG: hypothetical protein CSB16_01270 [Clostridiales bacterium]
MTIYNEKIELINRVFKTSVNKNPNMLEEFPLLLSEENDENLLYFREEKVHSVVGILYRDFKFGNITLKGSFIGSVCTDDRYRKKGLSSKLLDKALEKMNEDHVCLSLVSSHKRLYQRKGYIRVSNTVSYTIGKIEDSSIKAYKMDIREILKDERLLSYFIKAYNREKHRFVLSNEDIKVSLQSLHARGHIVYMFNKELPEFIVVRTKDGNGFIKDILGVAEDLDKKLGYIAREFKEVKAFINVFSEKNKELQSFCVETALMPSMVKIINLNCLVHTLNHHGYNIKLVENRVEINGVILTKDEFTRYLFEKDGKFSFMNVNGLNYQ